MNRLSVYVCSPYANAAFVRVIHERLLALSITPMSTWAANAHGSEDFSRMTAEALRRAAAKNDADLMASDVALVYDPDGRGRETYAEVARALIWHKPIVWVGRLSLSAWRSPVIRAEDLDAGIATLARMRDLALEGIRGELLARLAA